MRVATLGFALLVACSGGLEGEVVSEPVTDWSFLADAKGVAFETASGDSFTLVGVSPLIHEGALYLLATTIFSFDDGALDAVLAGEGVRMLAEGRLYDLKATQLTSAADIERLLPTYVRENLQVEATGIRWDPEPERYPGTQNGAWFFRLESVQARPSP